MSDYAGDVTRYHEDSDDQYRSAVIEYLLAKHRDAEQEAIHSVQRGRDIANELAALGVDVPEVRL